MVFTVMVFFYYYCNIAPTHVVLYFNVLYYMNLCGKKLVVQKKRI